MIDKLYKNMNQQSAFVNVNISFWFSSPPQSKNSSKRNHKKISETSLSSLCCYRTSQLFVLLHKGSVPQSGAADYLYARCEVDRRKSKNGAVR